MNESSRKGHPGRKRASLYVLCTLLLIIAAIIMLFLILGQQSNEKKQYEEKIRQETETMTDELITELDRINTSGGGFWNADEKDMAVSAKAPGEVISESEKQMIDKELKKIDDEKKRKILLTLSAAYSQVLNRQKQEAFSRLESLVAQAKADWAALGDGGDRAVKKAALIFEYLAKAEVLEEQTDASFGSLMSKMQEQLENAEIDSSEIIAQYKAEYKRMKEENRKLLMDKAVNAVKE